MATHCVRLVLSVLIVLSTDAFAAEADAELIARYQRSCATCHEPGSGVVGAPITGAFADWQPLLAKGMAVLVENVDKGIGAMPPKAMCPDCSREQYRALIEYMTSAQ